MDQFSSQLANNLENGYTAGVPDHLIQVYKELSAWCELIQYKIDVDINTQDDIRKQVLSNNLLKHIQGLWQEKVNQFYVVRRDEVRDNLSKVFQNRITNGQKIVESKDITEENSYNNIYSMPINEEYFNDNDSLSSEEDYYHEATCNDDNSKMVVVVKYNSKPIENKIAEDYIDFDDEYEFDYGNDDYVDYNEYDEYDFRHYKEANITKVNINYAPPEEKENMDIDYRDSHQYREYYERPATPSIPDWQSSYEDDDDSYSDNYLNNNTWNTYNNNYCGNEMINDNSDNSLSYTEQLIKQQKMEKEEREGKEEMNISYTEQLINEQRKLSYVSFTSIDKENENKSEIIEENEKKSETSEENENKLETSEENDYLSTQESSLPNNDMTKEEKIDQTINNINEKCKLSITIDDSMRNVIFDEETLSGNKELLLNDEHLYPRMEKFRDIYYEEYAQDSPTADSVISPNEEMLSSSTTDEELFEYSSKKVLLTPLSSSVLTYPEDIYSSVNDKKTTELPKEEPTNENVVTNEEEMNSNPQLKTEKIFLPPTEDTNSEREENKEEDFTKYLANRRDSGFSETCDEPFITI